MAVRQNFPYTAFTDPSGLPLSGGYILLSIDADVQSPSGLLCAGMTMRQDLDGNGTVLTIPQVWSNTDLLPAGSCYLLSAYAADGQLALGPMKVQV